MLGTCWGVSAPDLAVGVAARLHTAGSRSSRAAPSRARPGNIEAPGRAAAVSFACGVSNISVVKVCFALKMHNQSGIIVAGTVDVRRARFAGRTSQLEHDHGRVAERAS